jgi:hypothetical protein
MTLARKDNGPVGAVQLKCGTDSDCPIAKEIVFETIKGGHSTVVDREAG